MAVFSSLRTRGVICMHGETGEAVGACMAEPSGDPHMWNILCERQGPFEQAGGSGTGGS